jgi:hypothetical protein
MRASRRRAQKRRGAKRSHPPSPHDNVMHPEPSPPVRRRRRRTHRGYTRQIDTIAILLVFFLALGGGLVGFRMLGKQQRMYRDSHGPADLYRADDPEAGPPFDPMAPARAAEDFFAGGAHPQWVRGDQDADFSSHAQATNAPKPAETPWVVGKGEGWYNDPFGRHEFRWMSNGSPTSLVRDDAVESQDEPPSTST